MYDASSSLPLSAHSRSSDALRFYGVLLTIATLLLLPSSLLDLIGYAYGSDQGNFLMRIHPSSYIGLSVFTVLVLLDWRFGAGARARLPRPLLFYFLCLGATIVFTLGYNGVSSVAFLIDSLLMPGILLALLSQLEPQQQARFMPWLLGFMALNALIALLEAASGWRLLPYTIQGMAILFDTRSTAMFSHALNGACLMAVSVFCVLALPPRWWRWPLIGLFFAGLVAFGGRSALGILTVLLLVYALRAFKNMRLKKTFRLQSAALVMLLLLLVPVGVTYVFTGTSFGTRFAERLEWDDSAQDRLNALPIIDMMSTQQLLLGVSGEEMGMLVARAGLVWTIENTWLSLTVRFGLIFFVVFIAGLFFGLARSLWQGSNAPLRLGLVFFFLVISTNNGLAGKNTIMSITMLMIAVSRAQLSQTHQGFRP